MNTQNMIVGSALAIALGSGVAAQDSSTSARDRGDQQDRNSTITVTGCLTGGDQGGAAGGGGATSTSRSSGGNFMLMNATMSGSGSRSTSPAGGGVGSPGAGAGSPGAASPGAGAGAPGAGAGAPGAPGDSPRASSASTGSTYTLEGKTNELRPHVNHQVEITGKLLSVLSGSSSRPDSARPGSPNSGAGAGSPARPGAADRGDNQRPNSPAGASASAAGGQRLEVESVRMIAATCSR